jgi:hypothetical protein
VPAIFVHGNPETAAVWETLLAELERAGTFRAGLVCLSPPGFGAPLPGALGTRLDPPVTSVVGSGAEAPGG